jgi:hypothetical protein
MVLLGAPVDTATPQAKTIWSFHVLPNGPDRCRRIERRATLLVDGSLADRIFFSTLIIGPVGFVMGRRCCWASTLAPSALTSSDDGEESATRGA